MKSQGWLDVLKKNGHRLTGARRAIVELVADAGRVLTPLELYDVARKSYPALGLVSVYRTLEVLEQMRLIQRVHQPDGCQAFVAAGEGHQHLLLCQACGRAEFFEGDDLKELTQSIARKTGYKIQDHWLQLFGLCRECKPKA